VLKVGLISLGCARNLVDSEIILGSLKAEGFSVSGSVRSADICIINTCAFIGPAREESVDTILQAARLKKEGRIKKLVVCGCLSQAYPETLPDNLKEVDLFVGTSDFPKIGALIKKISGGRTISAVSRKLDYLYDENSPRFRLSPKHYAFVKISEGCSNFCSYCVISRLRGALRSRSIASVAKEITDISASGDLKEIDLIGQDTTVFGKDRYGKAALDRLLLKIAGLDNSVEWIRILYTHPAHYTDRLIDVIAGEDRICKYLDVPIQHISDGVLKRMNRRTSGKDIRALIDKLRSRISGLALRTSVIVGFPGETEKDFKKLFDFVKHTKFDRLGAFAYSKEDGTPSSRMKGDIPEKLKEERLGLIMEAQQKISLEANRRLVGRVLNVLIDEKDEDSQGLFIGRTERDAPDTDGTVHVSGKTLAIGKFYDVLITGALEYDLEGVIS